MSTGVILVVWEQGFKAFFCSRACLKKGQNRARRDGFHLEMYLFARLKLKSKAGVSNLVTSRHDTMISPQQLNAYLAQLVAPGQLQTGRVDIRDNIAYIYGKSGCQFGVYVDQGF